MKRKIAVVTTSSADYSHLYWPLRDLSAYPQVDLKLIVLGSYLSPNSVTLSAKLKRHHSTPVPLPIKKTGSPKYLESPVLWPQKERQSSFHAILLPNPKILGWR